MTPLVWHWGRRGGGPLFAARLADALRALPNGGASLSLAAGAEILAAPDAPDCAWREPTYDNFLGYLAQRAAGPLVRGRTRRHLQRLGPALAICAMPALLDARMTDALRRERIGYAAIVHDAEAHPGEALKFRLLGQRRLLHGARVLFALTAHVEAGLRRQGFGQGGQALVKLWHPPIGFGACPPPLAHGGRPRLLYFGRLLPYKGLDLLADAIDLLGPAQDFELRVCGDGPQTPSLARLRAQPGVQVEARWFAEAELPGLLAWADGLVLPYREASQSGVAALAIAAGRHVLATNVGGLPEQLGQVRAALLCDATAPAIAEGLQRLTQALRAAAAGPAPRPQAPAGWQGFAAAAMEVLGELPAL